MKLRWISIPFLALMIICARQEETDEALAKKSGCFQCHSVENKLFGPTFPDIAARYKNKPQARQALIETVKKGGKGKWTEVSRGIPMPPYSGRLTDAEIKNLVDWVLSL